MAKVGRNQPCPCGSGKKYKRCCESKDRAAKRPQASSTTGALPHPSSGGGYTFSAPSTGMDWLVTTDDPLCRLSNRVVELIDAGQLDEAEAAWEELNREFPDEIDPLERRAMLLEAQGEHGEAAAYYRRAAEYTRQHEGFEPAMTEYYVERAARLECDSARNGDGV